MDFKKLFEVVAGEEAPVTGAWESGELMMVYPPSQEGTCIMVRTFQDNGWTRVNYYWEDGTVEELFEGKEA